MPWSLLSSSYWKTTFIIIIHCLTRSDVKRIHKYVSRNGFLVTTNLFSHHFPTCSSHYNDTVLRNVSLSIFSFTLYLRLHSCRYSIFIKRFRHIKRLSSTSFAWLKQAERQPCLVITKSLLFVGLIGLSTLNMEVSPSLSLLCTYTRSLTSHQSEVDSEKENGRWH